MRYFFSAPSSKWRLLLAGGVKNYLLSWAVDAKGSWHKFQSPESMIMIDSGAFTVWAKGGKIDLDKYIDFCLDVKQKAVGEIVFVGLDQIPGAFGRKPSRKEILDSCKVTVNNFDYCLSKNLLTIPVYHQSEPLAVLDEYLARTEYVGLSPANDQPIKARMAFLNAAYSHVGRLFKAHSFGFAARQALERFPFYSADTTSWQSGMRYRRLKNPKDGAMNLIEDTSPEHMKLAFGMAGAHGKHTVKDQVRIFLEEETYITQLWRKRGVMW